MPARLTSVKYQLRRFNQVFMLAAVVIIAMIMTRGVFLRPSNLIVICASMTVFGLLSLGQALVVISGGFDLSVGSLISVAISLIVSLRPLMGLLPTTILAILITTAFGTVSGLLVAKTKIPPFIVTLGMLSIVASISWILIMGQYIKLKDYRELILPAFERVPFGENIFPILILILGLLGIGFLLHRTVYGRYLYAIGSNERVATAAGVPVAKTKIIVYSISAFMCAVGAVVYMYRYTTATPGTGEEYLLLTFAATMIGGVYMYGGEGTIPGVLIGIFIFASITHVMNVAGVPPTAHRAILGAIVLGVVLLQRWLKKE